MIEQIAKDHDKWLGYAKGICKDADMAADLVSDMYLKLLDKRLTQTKEAISSGYIYAMLKNMYIDQLNEAKKVKEGEAGYYTTATTLPDFENIEPEVKRELPNILTYSERQILLLRQEKSIREISSQFHLNRQWVWRKEKEALKKTEEWKLSLAMQ